MKSEYKVGTISMPYGSVDAEAVALACNLALAAGVQVVFGRLEKRDGRTLLPFATKGAPSIGLICGCFPGCAVSDAPLSLSLSDKRALQLASRVSGVKPKNDRVSAFQIRPVAGKTLLDEDIIGRKEQVDILRAIVKAVGAYGRDAVDSLHMVFVGPPGVGKTMIARRLLELYDKEGVTSGKGIFVPASATELVSQYVGETSHFVKRVFDQAEGGLLFIDEAYRLSRQSASVDGTSHGQEAIDAINQLLEERRDRTIVVFAGYPDEMHDFLQHNPGLHGRIGFEVEFGGYSDAELLEIFGEMARGRGFEVDKDVYGVLENRLPQLKAQEGFANARTMRKLVDRSVVKKALGELDWSLGVPDVERALEDKDFNEDSKVPVGFAG